MGRTATIRTRKEEGYRETTTAANTFSPNITDEVLVSRIRKYCGMHNLGKTKFVCDCIRKQLNELEKEDRKALLEKMSKEELTDIILSNGWRYEDGQSVI